MKKESTFVYVVFKVPCKESWSPMEVQAHLHGMLHYLEFSEQEEQILHESNTTLKQLVLPTFDGKTDVIVIHPQELSPEMRKKMEDNVMRLQDYIKKITS